MGGLIADLFKSVNKRGVSTTPGSAGAETINIAFKLIVGGPGLDTRGR